jgi:hypothetical protein
MPHVGEGPFWSAAILSASQAMSSACSHARMHPPAGSTATTPPRHSKAFPTCSQEFHEGPKKERRCPEAGVLSSPSDTLTQRFARPFLMEAGINSRRSMRDSHSKCAFFSFAPWDPPEIARNSRRLSAGIGVANCLSRIES